MSPFEKRPAIAFPINLTPKDIELVKKQCAIQGAISPEQIQGFANAYSTAKKLSEDPVKLNGLTAEQAEELILELGRLIEKRNQKGFRRVAVTFDGGGTALEHSKIPRAIQSFCHGFISFLEDPTEDERLNTTLLYTEFENIHPFEDGNGRVGDLLWKILNTKKNGKWPEALPPDVFGKEDPN